ncbi:DNA recombination protein RmuC [Blattabacterium sp. (Cryptocercus kyebangensis)]|uniref:DNA recombination protein RmuC n=1 Tax=Blattabacterium sp. (Cryptocercus kyebangensis) TaxID=298656 RepID=UPI000D7BF75D|nr:DNA recombination protein RmuC [Blattabacterium sp. (Cryptocercus kyebangensis)]AWU43899.1 DNA recombination protein RmuC [Blattabacterium sp. (Cryptocercus kyebangensis)]
MIFYYYFGILCCFIFFIFIYFFRKLEFFLMEKLKDHRNEIQKMSQYDIIEFGNSLKEIKNGIIQSIIDFQNSIDGKIQFYIESQSNKLNFIHLEQEKLVRMTEKKLEEIKENVNEKLQNSLNVHLGKSFEIIGNQLSFLQEGLGDMKNLAQDVNVLKRTLNHVKICGSFSEMQLSMLLQQILSPEQYACNVVTKSNTNFVVEFAIKLPGLGDGNIIWLPIDVKFPKETYEKVQMAYNLGEKKNIEIAKKNMVSVLKKMSKDIKDKYIDPPNTTDFAILFLPFEGIYAEIVKNSSLLEELQRKYKIVITGPSTLAAMLNSLQIGFRTLAIQKKSSEVWKILETVKKEFTKFGSLLHQAQDKLQSAAKDIDKVMGVRKNLIEKKLRDIENY